MTTFTAMGAQLRAAFAELFVPSDVELYGIGTVQIPVCITTRRANEGDITAGAVMDTQLIAKMYCDEWDAAAGREPQKGDVIHRDGKRYALDRASLAAPGGDRAFYTCRIMG